MKKALVMFDTPENQAECNELSCEKCSIMYDTMNAAVLPTCFYLEKSMLYLQMMDAGN